MEVATNCPTFQNHVLEILFKAAPCSKEYFADLQLESLKISWHYKPCDFVCTLFCSCTHSSQHCLVFCFQLCMILPI